MADRCRHGLITQTCAWCSGRPSLGAASFVSGGDHWRGYQPATWEHGALYYRVVGLLAARTRAVTAKVIPAKRGNFEDLFREAAHRPPGEREPGVVYLDDSADHWGNTLEVVFKATDGECRGIQRLDPDLTITDQSLHHGVDIRSISRSALVWELVTLGFRFGYGRQDRERVGLRVPERYRRDFMAGWEGAL